MKTARLRELDFLRGIAIILVLFNHHYLFWYTTNMGWIGVDLFFVLSGFFVSGLLFKEYQKFGNIKPGTFLIRRGFKIYPMYYLFCVIYLMPLILGNKFDSIKILSELTFCQNYVNGWGYAFGASWSLAVEEHFYFSLAISLWYIIKKKIITLDIKESNPGISPVELMIFSIMIACFLLRIGQNLLFPDLQSKNFTMTHLRIDSLLAGVLVSYLFYFRKAYLEEKFKRYKNISLPIAFLLLTFTPFVEENESFFIKTIGFSLVYISFSIILIHILLTKNINEKLNSLFGKYTVTFLSRVGVYSYSIYIVHTLINILLRRLSINLFSDYLKIDPKYIAFPLSVILSIICGKLMTNYIEKFFLTIRDRYYPNRNI
jgi:peptidoglycan/LPS O-acetylase OafA/YrhL